MTMTNLMSQFEFEAAGIPSTATILRVAQVLQAVKLLLHNQLFFRRFLHWQRPTHFQSVLPPQSLSESMLWPNNFCLQIYLTCLIYSDDERSTLLKAVITGPEETPYTGGVFEFHIYFPNKYPAVPPKVPQATCSDLYPLFCRFPSEPLGMGRCASTQTFTTMER